MAYLNILFRSLWMYRSEIALVLRTLSELRKSAEDLARAYVRSRLERNLNRQIAVVSFQTMLLLLAYFLDTHYHRLVTRLFASLVLWGLTFYNVSHLLFSTLPELRAVYVALRGKVGFTVRCFLRVSLFTELMELELVFLTVMLGLALSSRGLVATSFSYFRPWKELAQIHAPQVRPRARRARRAPPPKATASRGKLHFAR